MSEYILCRPVESDIPELKDIWESVFGAEGIDAFFSLLYDAKHTVIAKTGSSIAAMGYMIPAGKLICSTDMQNKNADKCKSGINSAMIYAMATLPQYRGKGLGAAVTNRLIENSFCSGYQAVFLCPSNDNLFGFYKKDTKLREFFYIDDKRISATRTGVSKSPAQAKRTAASMDEHMKVIPVPEYMALRELLLKDIIHIIYNKKCIEYQKKLCDEAHGGLFRIRNSCAIIEREKNGAVLVKELLLSGNDNERDILSAITEAFPSHEYVFRFPAGNEKNGGSYRFGMLALCDECGLKHDDLLSGINKNGFLPWYGTAFD